MLTLLLLALLHVGCHAAGSRACCALHGQPLELSVRLLVFIQGTECHCAAPQHWVSTALQGIPWFQVQQDSARHIMLVICLVKEHILPVPTLQHTKTSGRVRLACTLHRTCCVSSLPWARLAAAAGGFSRDLTYVRCCLSCKQTYVTYLCCKVLQHAIFADAMLLAQLGTATATRCSRNSNSGMCS